MQLKATSRFNQLTKTQRIRERFREQFPDTKIAAGYSGYADRTRYMIVYGITPFVIDDAKGKCFT